MYQSASLQEKWAPVLNVDNLPPIKDAYRRAVTAIVLEQQEQAMQGERMSLTETSPVNQSFGTGLDKYDPIMISLVRRALPNLMAYDVCGVQPMTGPVGLIFAMKSVYPGSPGMTGSDRDIAGGSAVEALFDEADTDFSGTGTHAGSNPVSGTYTTGLGLATASAEDFGGGTTLNTMAFTIEKTTVTAKSRALAAGYTIELAQDLKAIHGLDAEGELSNILSQEMLFDINREVIRTIYKVAKAGAVSTAVAGTFDLDVDSNGRWSVERFKGMLFQIEREANIIGQQTRRGKGNFIICTSDVAAALAMSGKLDYAPALSTDLQVDDTGNTFAGVLNGRYKVFIDPYSANTSAANQFFVVGYKGSTPYDAGIFYCPYVPLQMIRAVDPTTFQPKIAFKTRYGMIANPFVLQSDGKTTDGATFTANRNHYFRRVIVTNLL